MRMPRIKVHGRSAVCHCISRIVGGQFLLQDPEKEKFRQLMWKQAEFVSGFEIGWHFSCLFTTDDLALVRFGRKAENQA